MGQRAPLPPASWAEIRKQNRLASGKQAAPAEQPDNSGPAKELRKYEVLGPHTVFDAEPGSVVELALTEGEERALIESGHLALVDDKGEPDAPVVEEVTVNAEPAAVDADQE